eukprot:1480340-Pleurochrysis_carterae.AAC.3
MRVFQTGTRLYILALVLRLPELLLAMLRATCTRALARAFGRFAARRSSSRLLEVPRVSAHSNAARLAGRAEREFPHDHHELWKPASAEEPAACARATELRECGGGPWLAHHRYAHSLTQLLVRHRKGKERAHHAVEIAAVTHR